MVGEGLEGHQKFHSLTKKKILKNKVQQKISLLYRCYWNKAYDNNWKFPGKDQKLDMISYIFVGPMATKC